LRPWYFTAMRSAVLLAAAVGCGGSSDGPPSCDGAGDVVELDLLADTYIDGTAAHGGEGLVQIGNGTRGMFRFSLGPKLSTRDLKFTLVLNVPATADDCAPGCGACSGAVAAGGVTASLVRSDWNEPVVTSELRDAATPWSMPGPAGVDVVQPAATSATASGQTLSIGFNALGLSLNPSWPADQITVMVNPNATSTTMIPYSSRSNDCEPAAAPTLTAECTAASP
jgi:hypothetical protein